MNIHKFYPLQEPQPEEYDEAFVDAASNLIKRFGVLVNLPAHGSIVPSAALYAMTGDPRWYALSPDVPEFNITQNGNFAFDVGPGMAFSRNTISSVGIPMDVNNPTDLRAERIFISPADALDTYDSTAPTATDVLGNAMPRSTGCRAIPVLPGHTYYVYVKHLECVDATASATEIGNKYTINPQTGQLQYVHWIDGYQILAYRDVASTDPDDVYVGKIIVGALAIESISPAGRTYLSIPGPLVSSHLSDSLTPTLYPVGATADPVNYTDHINAVADINAVTLINPHGTTIPAIPGLEERFGIFSSAPDFFYTNGIIDVNSDPAVTRPGPFWAKIAERPGPGISVKLPVSGQAVAIGPSLFDSASKYYSQVYNTVIDPWVYQPVTGTEQPFCDFPLGVAARPIGYYFIYLEKQIVAGVVGAAVKAATFPFLSGTPFTNYQDMIENPGNYLATATQFPVALVYFNGTGFDAFAFDHQTRYSVPFNTFDLRRYGTISPQNISHDRRSYTALDTEVPQTGNLFSNNIIYSDHIKWIAQGPAMVVTGYPVVQTMVKKAGRVRRVTVFSDTIPVGGSPGLGIDVTKNGVNNSIFSTHPVIGTARDANTTGQTGATSAVIMDITENPAVLPDIGMISSNANYVNAGDRLQLVIREVGATGPGGDDLLVMVYIE